MPRASLNLSTRSDLAVPGGPTSSSGSWAMAATSIRSIRSCLWTKKRPSDLLKLLEGPVLVEVGGDRGGRVRDGGVIRGAGGLGHGLSVVVVSGVIEGSF